MLRYIFNETDSTVKVYFGSILEPTVGQISEILQENHNSPSGGHLGFHRTYKCIKKNYKWPSMKTDIAEFIKTCQSCQTNKLARKKNRKPMQITTTSSKAFERIALDIDGPLPVTEKGNKYVLTLQDDFTKYSQAYAIPNHEAVTISEILTSKFICTFGIPHSILTDRSR